MSAIKTVEIAVPKDSYLLPIALSVCAAYVAAFILFYVYEATTVRPRMVFHRLVPIKIQWAFRRHQTYCWIGCSRVLGWGYQYY